jgi:hypothetical protein
MLHYESLMGKIDYVNLLYRIYGSPKKHKKKFIEEATTWEYYPIYRDDKVIALILTKGNRIHCGCLPEYKGKWFPLKMYKRIMKNLLLKYGKVATATYPETEAFVKRLGFKEISRNNNVINFIKTEV